MTTVSSGQTYTVSSGQTDFGDIVLAGGTLDVLFGGVISNTIDSGTVQVGLGDGSGGTAIGTTVVSGGIEVVRLGGSAVETTVDSGGILAVTLGFALSTTVNNGGFEVVVGGVTSDTLVEAGGVDIAIFAQTFSTVVSSGGVQVLDPMGAGGPAQPIIPGAVANNTILDGGVQIVLGGADSTTINSGGTEVVEGGSDYATINSGGFEFLVAGNSDYNTVNNGGTLFVAYSYSLYNQVESGGVLAVYGSGSEALNDTISTGGTELVSGGGTASGSLVQGVEFVQNGGQTFSTDIVLGGEQIVQSGGVARDLIDAGLVDVQAGGLAFVTFTSNGGDLQLDFSQAFSGSISGFASPAGVTEAIDLRDIAFTSATTVNFTEAANNSSGTLTVTDGTHTANLIFPEKMRYGLDQFRIAAHDAIEEGVPYRDLAGRIRRHAGYLRDVIVRPVRSQVAGL